MIQMVARPNTTPILVKIGKVTFKDFILFRCCCSHASLWTVLRGVYAIVRGISSVANDKLTGTVKVWKCSFVSVC